MVESLSNFFSADNLKKVQGEVNNTSIGNGVTSALEAVDVFGIMGDLNGDGSSGSIFADPASKGKALANVINAPLNFAGSFASGILGTQNTQTKGTSGAANDNGLLGGVNNVLGSVLGFNSQATSSNNGGQSTEVTGGVFGILKNLLGGLTNVAGNNKSGTAKETGKTKSSDKPDKTGGTKSEAKPEVKPTDNAEAKAKAEAEAKAKAETEAKAKAEAEAKTKAEAEAKAKAEAEAKAKAEAEAKAKAEAEADADFQKQIDNCDNKITLYENALNDPNTKVNKDKLQESLAKEKAKLKELNNRIK